MFDKLYTGYMIMFFYAFLVCVVATIGFKLKGNKGFNYGAALGTILSVVLWCMYGKKYAKLEY